jgi:protein-L-isoaspartate(D-aspartate) O-methyltransferase
MALVEVSADNRETERVAMVEEQLASRGIHNPKVLDAMRNVPRHRLVPPDQQAAAYGDHPLPIGHGQTISQPYIVALMTQLLEPLPGERVLEIGTGSGYQAAVLAELVSEVYSIEIIDALAERASKDLADLGYKNIQIRQGDGFLGWPEKSPFDAIIVTCAPEQIPPPLVEQLKEGGRMILPLGDDRQDLILLRKEGGEIHQQSVIPVRFVPMTGQAREPYPGSGE